MHSTTHFHAQKRTNSSSWPHSIGGNGVLPRVVFPLLLLLLLLLREEEKTITRGRRESNNNRSRFGKRSSSFASSSSSRNDDELGAFLCRSSTSDDDVNIKNNNDDAISVSLPLNELKPGEKQSRVSSIHRRSEFVQISSNKAKTINPPENLSKLQLFGRKYWPLLATLELLALIGASLNGVLSRKRRQEIERLNVQSSARI